jgi:MFS family permease
MIYVFSFLMDMTVVYLMLGLNFRGVDAGASPTELGILTGSGSLSYSFLCFVLARRLSLVEARLTFIISSIFLIVLCFLSMVVWSVPLFVLLTLLIGAASAFFWPPLEHRLGEGKSHAELYRALSRFNLWWCSGYAVATATCGQLYNWDFRVPFLVAAGCLIPIVAGSPLLARGTADQPHTASSEDTSSPSTISVPQKRFFLVTARIFIFLSYASAGCLFALFPKLGEVLRLGKPLVSHLLFSLYLGQLLSFYVLSKTRAWQENLSFLFAGQLLMAASFLAVFLFNHVAVFAAAFAAVGVVSGLTYFSSLFYTLHEPVFRSSLAGVHEAFLSAGRLIGPIIFGVVASLLNLKAPYLFLACIFALFALFTIWQGERVRRRAVPNSPPR